MIKIIKVLFLFNLVLFFFTNSAISQPKNKSQSKPKIGVIQAKKAFIPIRIRTEKLTIYGKEFSPVNKRTEKLTITGKVFSPVNKRTEKLTITGKVFTPVNIRTEKLTITGKKKK